jgi:hypothetical protein
MISPIPRKFVWDPEHWRFRAEEARTVADQMTHEEARAIMRRIANDYDSPSLPRNNSPLRKSRTIERAPCESPRLRPRCAARGSHDQSAKRGARLDWSPTESSTPP